MIYQTNTGLPKPMQKYGCAFTSLAYYRERYQSKVWTTAELGSAWTKAIALGIVTGDLNGDGDLDDGGEAEIRDWTQLVVHLGLKLQYLGKFPQGHPFTAAPGNFCVTSWTNPVNGFVHWVVGDKRPVEFDPIGSGSVTVRVGILCPMDSQGRGGVRVFKKL